MSTFKSFSEQWLLPQKTEDSELPSPLQYFKKAQLEILKDMPLPDRKMESWRYSSGRLKTFEASLQEVKNSELSKIEKSNIIPLEDIKEEPWIQGTDEHANQIHIKLVDGRFIAESSQTTDDNLSEKIRIQRFSELADEQAQEVVDAAVNHETGLPFLTLNSTHLCDGIYITAGEDTPQNTLLHIHHISRNQHISAPRIHLVVKENAELTLIESYTSELSPTEDKVSGNMVVAVSSIVLKANSKLHFIRHTFEEASCSHVGLSYVEAYANSFFESHCTGIGGHLRRHDVKVKLLEPGAECSLNAVTVTQQRQHYDNHTEIEHIAAGCTSNENYRCIAADHSHIVFNGRIHIHPNAQKTVGAMSNKNLLLSSSAEIDTKPELEIYADDVKCSHGATVGELDKEELYYLLTRGISRDDANTLLTMAFVMDIVAQIPDAYQIDLVKKRLQQFIQDVFNHKEVA